MLTFAGSAYHVTRPNSSLELTDFAGGSASKPLADKRPAALEAI